MDKEVNCCNERPVVWRCTCNTREYCGCDCEKIECNACGRIIWGADEDSVKRWNAGENDEPSWKKI